MYTFTDRRFFVAKSGIFTNKVYFARALKTRFKGQFKYTFLGIFINIINIFQEKLEKEVFK